MPGTPRQLAREHTMAEIVRIGRAQLNEVGPADLSLRAIARELGIVSSAIYRYVASRDALLTLLIVDAYDELGQEVEDALADGRGTPRARMQKAAAAVRTWALREPARYALIYGTPIRGYEAPAETTTQAGTRVVVALVVVLELAYVDGVLEAPTQRLDRATRADLEAIRKEYGIQLPATLLLRAFAAWSGLFGLVSFDVFDHYGPGTLTDREAFFAHQVDLLADVVGLP